MLYYFLNFQGFYPWKLKNTVKHSDTNLHGWHSFLGFKKEILNRMFREF